MPGLRNSNEDGMAAALAGLVHGQDPDPVSRKTHRGESGPENSNSLGEKLQQMSPRP